MKDRNLIAKYRCENEIRGGQYWRKEEDKRCRICWQTEEIYVWHVLKECSANENELK